MEHYNNDIESDDILEYIMIYLHPNEESLGKLVATIYKNEYCVVDNRFFWCQGKESSHINSKPRNVWYKYNIANWGYMCETNDKYKFEIRNKLGDEVLPLINKAISLYKKDMKSKNNTEGYLKNDRKLSDLYKARDMLCDTNHRNNILIEAEARLFIEPPLTNNKIIKPV